MGKPPAGFAFQVLASGDVVITRNQKRAATLRGATAAGFLAEVEKGDPQEIMARVTGNYKRGNERSARMHPRHRGR
jgi:hypothetical protein